MLLSGLKDKEAANVQHSEPATSQIKDHRKLEGIVGEKELLPVEPKSVNIVSGPLKIPYNSSWTRYNTLLDYVFFSI